ncbi:MAG TPA: hypothetical protein VFA68_15515 [Terriglobales bacterium]|nr:hypothetical protein [Terriglobales bacterium]
MQRLIVAQINQVAGVQSNDTHAGPVDYSKAPWFDWGPYLWASGQTQRQFDLLVWCNGQGTAQCPQTQLDVRYGDRFNPNFWGDFTHPTAMAAEKVAKLLMIFIGKDPDGVRPGSPFVLPWVQK